MKNSAGSKTSSNLGFIEKSAFACANLGNVPLMTLISAFLLIFYTDVVGLNPAAVATMFLISRILDGFNDPIMGFVVDHMPKSKLGRFRPYLMIGSVICGLNYLLLWLGPAYATSGKLVIAYISYLLIGISFDLMDIPLNSMIPVMSSKDKDRNTLSAIKAFSYMIGAILFVFMAPYILGAFPTQLEGYTVLIIIAAAFVMIFSIVGALGIKEHIQPISEKKYHIKDLIPIITSRPVLITFVCTLLLSCGNAAKQASDLYFCTYVIGDPKVMSILSLGALAALPGIILSMPMSAKLGKRATFCIFMLVSFLGLMMRFLSLTSVPLLIACTFVFAFGSYGKMALSFSIQADNIDYVEWRRNQRAEGGVASLNTFVTKAAQGLGGAVPGYVLALAGYVPNAEQSKTAIMGISVSNIVLPAATCLVGALIFYFGYNIDKKNMAEIQNCLNTRRTKKAEEEAKSVLTEAETSGEGY